MEQMEIQEQFEALVNKGVVKALSPYKDAIIALAELVRSAAPDAQEKRPAARKKEDAEPRAVEVAVEAAKRFSVGQVVIYKQGRGDFRANVEEINSSTGVLYLKRISDGKMVERPASKVSAV